jgi:hypothetical protein
MDFVAGRPTPTLLLSNNLRASVDGRIFTEVLKNYLYIIGDKIMEGLLDKIKKDVKKGLEEGLAAVVQGASVVSLKMNELSAEGKKQYKIFNLHVKIKDQMNELGDIACAVLESGKSLDEDKKIKAAFTKIKKLQWQLSKLEGSPKIKTGSSKKPAGKTVKKSTAKKQVLKKNKPGKPAA